MGESDTRAPGYIRGAEEVKALREEMLTRGRCHPKWRTPQQEKAWILNPGEPGYNHKQALLARGECVICTAQWSCVTYAMLAGDEHGRFFYGIWAATPAQRDRLSRFADWRQRVEEARSHAIPVQVMIRQLPDPGTV